MPVISLTLPNDGDSANASTVDTPFTTIVNLLNGGLDHDNMVDGGITGAKLVAATVTPDKLSNSTLAGWAALSVAPNSVTDNGNRSYQVVFNSIDLTSLLSPGMRMRLTRSVAAPHQCTSLNGSTQYYSKSSPAGMTFTDTFTCSAWVKLTSYAQGAIISRFNGTSGWLFDVNASGQVVIIGYNGGPSNNRSVTSTQSLPLNKWVHVFASLQMSDHTSSTSYIYIDKVLVPSTIATSGTNPTALIQAGNLEVGSDNGGTIPFPGELAQVAVYSAVISTSTMIAASDQTLAGTETNLVSAYSFNNTINDLNTSNANNLTANGSAVATATDSPFAQGATAGTLEYGIITAAAFSTNTTLTVQVPEGSALPTAGGIVTAEYAAVKVPYNFPALAGKWTVEMVLKVNTTQSSPGASTWYNLGQSLNVPIGAWKLWFRASVHTVKGSAVGYVYATLSTSSTTAGVDKLTDCYFGAAGQDYIDTLTGDTHLTLASATPYYLNALAAGTVTTLDLLTATDQAYTSVLIRAENDYL